MQQKMNTPVQQKWVMKLMDFEFDIVHKWSTENMVADALSRQLEDSEDAGTSLLQLWTRPMMDLWSRIEEQHCKSSEVQDKKRQLEGNQLQSCRYRWRPPYLYS